MPYPHNAKTQNDDKVGPLNIVAFSHFALRLCMNTLDMACDCVISLRMLNTKMRKIQQRENAEKQDRKIQQSKNTKMRRHDK